MTRLTELEQELHHLREDMHRLQAVKGVALIARDSASHYGARKRFAQLCGSCQSMEDHLNEWIDEAEQLIKQEKGND